METILTSKEKYDLIIVFIQSFSEKNGISPSLREICTGTGISSTATMSKHLRRMREAGLIEYKTGVARCIRVCDKNAAAETA